MIVLQLPADMITLDAEDINKVNTTKMEEEMEKKSRILYIKPPQVRL